MDNGQQREVHISVQRGLSMPPLKKCYSCCFPGKFHCPFCSVAYFKPTTKYCSIRIHLNNHLKRAIYVGEHTIHRCRLDCGKLPHFHCLYCTNTVMKKSRFIRHMPFCQQAQRSRAPNSQLQAAMTLKVQIQGPNASFITPGESETPSYDSESNGDSGNLTITADSDDHSSQGASSSSSTSNSSSSSRCGQPVFPIIPKSNECDTVGKMKKSTAPVASTCHRTVQTDIDKPQDCDEYYFMNLVKMFKKLSPQKKAEVRMKIERLLFEAEFE